VKRRYFFVLLLLGQVLCLSAQSGDTPQEETALDNKRKYPFSAASKTLFSNVLLMGINDYVFDFPWAGPTPESINQNFTGPWDWEDTDGFIVNNIGHPYQGSVYFNAGRSNGYNFYESIFFSFLGSITWEYFGERQQKSANDLIATTLGSLSIGEMLHRLYLIAGTAGLPGPVMALISPMDSFNRITTKRGPKQEFGSLYGLSFSAGAGFADSGFTEREYNRDLYSFLGPAFYAGADIVYGNPFEQRGTVPFEHFELITNLEAGIGNYMNIRLISDGYLFSFLPVNTASSMLSTGLSLHYDFVSSGAYSLYASAIDQYSNALDWTVKYRHLFKNDTALQIKLHSGGTFFGVSEYYSPRDGGRNLKNYGGGINEKFHISLQTEKFGELSLDMLYYTMWTYPGTVPFSNGKVRWFFFDLTYSRRISEKLSFGITRASARESGYFDGLPDTQKNSRVRRLFMTWDF
jgi:hypothetical protein